MKAQVVQAARSTTKEPRRARESEHDPLPPAPDITPDTDFTGSILRAVRHSKGIRLEDVAGRVCVKCPWHSYQVSLGEGRLLYTSVVFENGKPRPGELKVGKRVRGAPAPDQLSLGA